VPTRIAKPIRPGSVIRFTGEPTPVIPPSVAETAAVPIVHDWGPINTPVLVTSFPEFEQIFGQGQTPGRTAVLGAFAGQALPGQGGAGGVFVYRMAASAAAAKVTLSGLSLLATSAGSRGNGLKAIVENDPGGDALRQQFRLLLNNAQVERYSYLKAQPQDLAAAINQRSNYVNAGLGAVTATKGTVTAQARQVSGRTVAVDVSGADKPMTIVWGDGSAPEVEDAPNQGGEHTYAADGSFSIKLTPLGGVSPTDDITLAITLPWAAATPLTNGNATLTGGADGSTLTVNDWMDALTAMEYLGFSVFAPYDLTDPAIRATLVSWVKGQDTANRPVMAVLGGPADETVDQAITDARAMNCEHVVRLAGGYFRDDVLGASVSTSQLAPRVAGMLCSLGDANSLTFKPIGGLAYLGQGFANDQIEAAIQNGVTSIAVSTNPAAPLRIERGLTTFVTTNDPTRPLDFFSDPRLVRLVDLFIRRMKEWGDNTMIGNVPVNDDSRTALRARARAEIDDLELRGLIVAGTDYLDVPVPTDPDLLDSLIYEFGFQCARTALYIFGFGSVR
jgi:Phage tail sheath protein subtilisin-like domain